MESKFTYSTIVGLLIDVEPSALIRGARTLTKSLFNRSGRGKVVTILETRIWNAVRKDDGSVAAVVQLDMTFDEKTAGYREAVNDAVRTAFSLEGRAHPAIRRVTISDLQGACGSTVLIQKREQP